MERFNEWYADPKLSNEQLQNLLDQTVEQMQNAQDAYYQLYISVAGIRNVIKGRMQEGMWYEGD